MRVFLMEYLIHHTFVRPVRICGSRRPNSISARANPATPASNPPNPSLW